VPSRARNHRLLSLLSRHCREKSQLIVRDAIRSTNCALQRREH
jgi:hypothetical protein